jgi:hypothetical protein
MKGFCYSATQWYVHYFSSWLVHVRVHGFNSANADILHVMSNNMVVVFATVL